MVSKQIASNPVGVGGVVRANELRAARGITAHPVAIADLEAKFGWASGSWQDRLLKSAAGPCGTISCEKLDAYLANPANLGFLNSTDLVKAKADLQAKGGTVRASSLRTGWEKALARAADANKDGKLTQDEFQQFSGKVTMNLGSAADAPVWIPDQKQAELDDKIAQMTGELDLVGGNVDLGASGGGAADETLDREYMHIDFDPTTRTARWVSYELSAADQALTPADVKRKDNFHADPNDPNSATPADYNNTGFDRGHQKPAEDSPNMEAMNETFLMTNMAPQSKQLNEQSWRTLEDAVRQLVNATGAKATIVTGSLYRNADGSPQTPEQMSWIGTNGQKRVAVPTDSYKIALIQYPDGRMQSLAYVVPNRADLPTKAADIQKLLQGCRTSVSAIEKAVGTDFFAQLSPSARRKLENDSTSPVIFPNADKYNAASLLWPQPTSNPQGVVQHAVDEHLSQVMPGGTSTLEGGGVLRPRSVPKA